jgi:DNA polymerase IV
VRAEASVLHLDLDAFYASVEQRDKPSLRGRPVVVGGIGQRGVVATASYEARAFGVRSAMPTHEARRRCPHAAFLIPRFGRYHAASEQVMAILRDLSLLVEPLSLDEAFVDLRAATRPVDLAPDGLARLIAELKAAVAAATGGLTASIGIASSKFMAKVASELEKPDGSCVVAPGTEAALIAPMPVSVIPGVGPVTADKLRRIGIEHVADLARIGAEELSQLIGKAHGNELLRLARAEDDRPVEPDRETKSISVEDTFETDLTDPAQLRATVQRDAATVARRLGAAQLFAHTVTLKVRLHDFTTLTRARSLAGATNRADLISDIAVAMLAGIDATDGVRLLGVGVAGLTEVVQDDLFAVDEAAAATAGETVEETASTDTERKIRPGWPPGADVLHDSYGAGWVWGAGLGRVTVRFETADTGPGPVRTFADDDPALRRT